jgi:hypothetical protein
MGPVKHRVSDEGDRISGPTVGVCVIDLIDRFEAEVERLRKVTEYLDRFEVEVKRLTRLRASLEEELLTRIEGYQPQ